MKKIHKKHYLTSLILILLFAFTLLGCQQNSSDQSPDEADAEVEENPSETETEEAEDDKGEPSDSKPEVAEIKANNEPNRMITSFNGDTRTQMGFNWYTTDLFTDAKVWVSTSEDLSDAIVFEAEATEVTNRYA